MADGRLIDSLIDDDDDDLLGGRGEATDSFVRGGGENDVRLRM